MFPFRVLTLFTAKDLKKTSLAEHKFKVNKAYKSAIEAKLQICTVANCGV
jgi:hypothetical protein